MENCIFCNHLKPEQILTEAEYFKLVYDIDPIQEGHLLLISKKHYMDLREVPLPALKELLVLEQKLATIFEEVPWVDGLTFAQNNGKLMDKDTHFHVHVIPRFIDDGFWEKLTVPQRNFPFEEIDRQLKELMI